MGRGFRTLIRWTGRASRQVVIVVVASCITAGGVAYATSSKTHVSTVTTGMIQACAHMTTGALRLVGDPSACHRTENYVSWNAEGPSGPSGPSGPQGDAGPSGPS